MITPAELAAAREQHAKMDPIIKPIFAAPVEGDGLRGDIGIDRPAREDAPMVSRDDAVAIALKLAADDPDYGPIERVGDVFSMDGGRTWMVHLVPIPLDLGNGIIAVDTPGTWPVRVCGLTGQANWVETL